MKKILLFVLISIMLSGCTEEVMMVVKEETILTEEEKQEQIDKLKEEYKIAVKEYITSYSEQTNGQLSFVQLGRLFKHIFGPSGLLEDKNAMDCLLEMLNTYAKFENSLFYIKNGKNPDVNINIANMNDIKNEIEHIKIFIEMMQNDRNVLWECIESQKGNKLVAYKNSDQLYSSLKKYVSSLK